MVIDASLLKNAICGPHPFLKAVTNPLFGWFFLTNDSCA
jgi:hypothetical protein